MDRFEKEAILKLRPQFSPDPIVVDVGSNEGDIAALFTDALELHLFEPDQRLMHYTQVRFKGFDNITYHNLALGDYLATVDFYQYPIAHSGQNSIYDNSIGLPRYLKKVKMDRLDRFDFDYIDFLKIDVEGAENLVIKGCKGLLERGAIKFIQFEHGHTATDDLINFAKRYDYNLFDFDGDRFNNIQSIISNERKNYYLMQEFTEDWNEEFKKNTDFLKGKVKFALEIGCFEGLTSCYICDNLLKEGGRMVCIDPLEDQYLIENLTEEDKAQNTALTGFKGQYDRFIRNTKTKPVELIRTTSMKAFKDVATRGFQFDFIYIDGDHREKGVNADANLYWNQLQDRGYMLFDDYQWSEGTKKGIDNFIKDHAELLKVIIHDYQVMIQKWIP